MKHLMDKSTFLDSQNLKILQMLRNVAELSSVKSFRHLCHHKCGAWGNFST